jgi:tRNA 5-methylaminomethyl-2-thiouridine biosynthesis bifunctional protein
MKGAPRSDIYDDVYFSTDDGLAESCHVFLAGNDLPYRWQNRAHFTVCEVGFGTGLNLLAMWDIFEKDPQHSEKLHFISFEKHALTAEQISEALKPWRGKLGHKIDVLVAAYPTQMKGIQNLKLSSKISVTLIFDDVNDAIQNVENKVDCWFLDGFTPSKNPQMWSEVVFKNMGRLSHEGTSLATFTAAGFVKRGLQKVGFEISKRDGFGKKRNMLVGIYSEPQP